MIWPPPCGWGRRPPPGGGVNDCARIQRSRRSIAGASPGRRPEPQSMPIEGPTMNAIQLLKDDHKKVKGLLAELEATTARGTKKRTQLLATIATELRVHT